MVAVAEMFHFSIEDEFKRELKLLSRQIDHSRAQRKLAAELAAAKAAKANAATIDDNASVVSGSDVTSNAGVGFGQTLITKRGVQRQSSYLKDSTTSSNDTPQPTVNPVELKRQREEVTQRKKEEKEEKEKLRLENLKENPTEMGGDVQFYVKARFGSNWKGIFLVIRSTGLHLYAEAPSQGIRGDATTYGDNAKLIKKIPYVGKFTNSRGTTQDKKTIGSINVSKEDHSGCEKNKPHFLVTYWEEKDWAKMLFMCQTPANRDEWGKFLSNHCKVEGV